MEYLNTLPIWHLILLSLTFVVGVSFSIGNYLKSFVSPMVGGYTQSDLGRIIDWLWLTSVLVLVTLYYKG